MGNLGFSIPFLFALVPNLMSSQFLSFGKNHLKRKCHNAVINIGLTRTLGKEESIKEIS